MSDLLLVVVGCWHGVRVADMGCGLPVCVVGEVWEKKNWEWPCGLPACVVGEVWEKKLWIFLIF